MQLGLPSEIEGIATPGAISTVFPVGVTAMAAPAAAIRRVSIMAYDESFWKPLAGIRAIQDRANQVPYHGPYQEPIK